MSAPYKVEISRLLHGAANPIKMIAKVSCTEIVPSRKPAQHRVHPTGGSRRVFKQFAWLEVGSDKIALSRPAHQRVTQAVGRQAESLFHYRKFSA
jgi:hypothetical protein